MPRALSSVRLDEDATCKYVLFIEGLPIARTSDTTGALWGSGLDSWIYLSEVAIGGREISGTRSVLPGLIVPESVSFEIDIKTGALQPAGATFQILDTDGTLADLFATEEQTAYVLDQRVAPGTANLGASVNIVGGLTTNPRGQWIGIEKIGPAGERRQWPALPFDLVGLDHPVHAGADPPNGLPPVTVSPSPIEFAGRMVTLYRIYKDPELPLEEGASYYTWDEAHAAGDLVWWGLMRDAGRVSGSRVWSIDCHGPDAMTRKTLGTRNTVTKTRIAAALTLDATESSVAIEFRCRGVAGASVETYFNSSIFDHAITATDRAGLATEINGWIESALTGASFNVAGSGGDFETWLDAEGVANPDAGVTIDGKFFVRRESKDLNDDLTYGVMWITMHSRAWRVLGFEPETQHRDGPTFPGTTDVAFSRLTTGADYLGEAVPGSGYWRATFTTIERGYAHEDIDAYDNDGAPREWWPYHTSEVFVLDQHGRQALRLLDEEPTSLYLEGQLTAGFSQFSEINATQTDRARWVMMSGDRVTVEDDAETADKVEVSDAIKVKQIACVSWVQGSAYGTVSEGVGFEPLLYVEHYLDPRGFGIDNEELRADWSGKTSGKGAITLTPLNAYHYFLDDSYEHAPTLLAQIMLSTGASVGYNGTATDDGGSVTAGPNTHTSAPAFAGDYELADLGLAIPYQIVQHPDDMRVVFDTLPGGGFGDLCRLRLAYAGPFKADDVIDSIMRPRLLCWSLAGKQFGIFRMGPVSPEDADISITESDLHGVVGDPASVIPVQSLRATGQLDGIALSYRWDPSANKTAIAVDLPALDAGANRRTGELVEKITDHGLCPTEWFDDSEWVTGVTDWRPLMRQLWQHEAATFLAKRHYSVTLNLSRPKGQDAMPGSAIALTNQWLVSPTGTYGVTAATGRIISATHMLREGRTEIRAIVFATPTVRHYAPFVRVRRWAAQSVEYYPDTLGHGVAAYLDGIGFGQPTWSTGTGDFQASLVERIGDTWTVVDGDTVASVDTATRTITLDNGFSLKLRDRDYYLMLSDQTAQAGAWPATVYGPMADDDLTIGDATNAAAPFTG